MTFLTFVRIICVILGIVGSSMLLPIGVAFFCGEQDQILVFVIPMLASLFLAVLAIGFGGKKQISLSTRSVFGIVASVWLSISLFGAVPLALSGYFPSFIDAFFESVSGFSTTGATILSEVEVLPRCLNLWRCEMHWLGGMGVIALTVALMPLLGVGGFALMKAESTGVEKGKITPKIANTAETLWLLYFGFTLIQAILLMVFGMDFIDAISHAFATLGTGGFSTRNASIGAYHSVAIEIICTVFMFLAGINFSLYFYVLARKFDEVGKNTEFKTYIFLFFAVVVAVTLILIGHYDSFTKALRYGVFQVASIMTTTGFATCDYMTWPSAAQFLIFMLFFIGGSSGSTAGGFKVVRWVVLAKQAKNEVMRMLHPHGVFTVRLNGQPGRRDLVFNVAAFTFVYLLIIAFSTFLGTFAHLEVFSSFTATLSMVGNIGPAFDQLGPTANYGGLPQWLKVWYSFAMIAGRLELYNLIIFFVPEFWKK